MRRIYVAVRDESWNTVPGTYSGFEIGDAPGGFTVRFEGQHRHGTLDFIWQATISGSAEGVLSYEMVGLTNSDFLYNRIGLNVHHPLAISAGRPFRARTPEGAIDGRLPELIGQQKIEGGFIHALFPAFEAITIDLEDGRQVHFEFEGDLFEIEDHRNWTDANFKTYAPSLMLGFPLQARSGQHFRHKVTVSMAWKPSVPRRQESVHIEIDQSAKQALPAIGLGMASHGGRLSAHEVELLRELRIDHLRADLYMKSASLSDALNLALQASAELRTGLELALFLEDDSLAQVDRLRQLLGGVAPQVRRVLVYGGDGVVTTPADLVLFARRELGKILPGARFGGGTNQFFAELNRIRPQVDAMDVVAFSLSPQVHASDDAVLVENLEGQLEVMKSARAFSGGKEIVVTPVTLLCRNGPYPAGPPQPNGLPPQVDVRQPTLFAAAWTVGSIGALASGGAGSVTYYETSGWRGVIDTDVGSPMPERFPTRPGAVFPVYHVLADVGEWKGGVLQRSTSSDPVRAQALAVRLESSRHFLVVNLTDAPQTVTVGPVHSSALRVRSLDAETVVEAMTQPSRFRQKVNQVSARSGRAKLALQPHAVVRVDDF